MRVVSYNLRGLRDDTAAIATVVSTLAPDVLLLQEVPRHPGAARRIATLATACSLTWPGRRRWLAGTAVMTGPHVSSGQVRDHRLPVQGLIGRSANPRGFTTLDLSTPTVGTVVVASIHLSLIATERRRHVEQICDALPGLADGAPVVLGGDLNEGPDGPARQALTYRYPEVTGPEATFPSRRPSAAIDAIFADPRLRQRPEADRKVWLDPALLTAASDHHPVWADLELAIDDVP